MLAYCSSVAYVVVVSPMLAYCSYFAYFGLYRHFVVISRIVVSVILSFFACVGTL